MGVSSLELPSARYWEGSGGSLGSVASPIRLARPGRPSIGGGRKSRCSAAPLNGWHRSPVCTSDPGHTWPGRHWRSSSCDWSSGPERSRLWASPPCVCALRALAHGADGGRSSGSDRNSSRSKPDQRDRQRLSNPGPGSARATLRHRRGQVANLVQNEIRPKRRLDIHAQGSLRAWTGPSSGRNMLATSRRPRGFDE